MEKYKKYLNEEVDKGDVTEMYEEIQRMRKQVKQMWKNTDTSDAAGKENRDALKKVLGNLQDASRNIESLKL